MSRRVYSFILIGCITAGVLAAGFVKAATLEARPASRSLTVGDSITMRVTLSSPDTAVNAVQGTLTYPPALLSVTNVSTAGTVMGIWVHQPADNGSGQINWSGGIFNPGFTGTSGTVFTVSFKALAAGTADVKVVSGAVLAADGKGTNVLSDIRQARYTVTKAGKYAAPSAPNAQPSAPSTRAPVEQPGPKVTSPTHPDQKKWYNATTFTATWTLEPKASGVSIMLNDKYDSNPGPLSDGLISENTYTGLSDGTHYFHLKFLYPDGTASPITHFLVRVDTTPPEQLAVGLAKETNSLHQPILTLSATDSGSGIASYEVKVGAGSLFRLRADAATFTVPVVSSGTYLVDVKAYDKAGNYTEKEKTVLANVLEAPRITGLPPSVLFGDSVTVSGTAEPNGTVHYFLWQGIDSKAPVFAVGTAMADDQGTWSFVYSRLLAPGRYTWRFSQRNALGAESAQGEPLAMTVTDIVRVGTFTLPLKMFLAGVGVLVLALLIALGTLIRAYVRFAARARREKMALEERVVNELEELKHEMVARLRSLGRLKGSRQLTPQEQKIEKSLTAAINHIEGNMRNQAGERRGQER